MELGYALSSEEHAPLTLVENARRAEEAGFTFALVSDHFHPWIDRQDVHQVGPDRDVFFDLYEREVLPAYSSISAKS